jgi:SAM-dependent methyltransferase
VASTQPDILGAAYRWWNAEALRTSQLAATGALFRVLWEFARDSTPSRLRQRYGDADYDWEHRVNTTGGAVGWRDRLLGVFYSAYQPTEPSLFHEMLEALHQQEGFDFSGFTFVDLGSGKGRTLLMASDYAFQRVIGVELLPALNRIAQENLSSYRSPSQRCFQLESICADATTFPLPPDPLLIYLFIPSRRKACGGF